MIACRVIAVAVLALLAACATTPPPAMAPAGDVATGAPTVPATSVVDDPAARPADVVVPPPATAAQTASADTVASDPAAAVARDPAVADSGMVDSTEALAANGTLPPTQAELDYAALYGEPYDPVADPTLPTPAQFPVSYDPWEPFNRRMHRVNQAIDRRIAKPLAKAYVEAVPRPVRLGAGNFFRNLGQPVAALNSLLQGKPKQAGQALARFALNSTLGIAGIFDPASDLGLPLKSEDFGQTLGVWGWERSRYVELPLFGPRTVRDVVGLMGDSPLSLIRGIEEDKTRVFLQGLQLVDVRTQLFAVDGMLEGAPDEYALLRDAWLQRRNYQIFGDETLEGDDSLPDYLREEYNPTVPVDAMPIVPGDGG